MVAIPTTQDEDAKRPNREHESLVGEQSRIVNRMKAALIRLGIRGFNPKLKKAAERLDGLRTPEGEPIPVPVGNSILLATDIESSDAPIRCESFAA
jgi:transposase